MSYSIFPTNFACTIASIAGLIPRGITSSDCLNEEIQKERNSDPDSAEILIQDKNTLVEFQQLSLVSNFDTAFMIYSENDLRDDQIDALRIIYKMSKPFFKSEIVQRLFFKIDTDTRSMAQIAQVINDMISAGGFDIPEFSSPHGKRFVMQLTGINEKGEYEHKS